MNQLDVDIKRLNKVRDSNHRIFKRRNSFSLVFDYSSGTRAMNLGKNNNNDHPADIIETTHITKG
jgi:hypothetical protein